MIVKEMFCFAMIIEVDTGSTRSHTLITEYIFILEVRWKLGKLQNMCSINFIGTYSISEYFALANS